MSFASLAGTRLGRSLLVLVQALLVACALVMAVWVRAPWLCLVGFSLLAAGMAGARFPSSWSLFRAGPMLLAGSGTVAVAAGVILARGYGLDFYHTAIAWQAGLALALVTLDSGGVDAKQWWKKLSVLWFFLGATVWLAASYRDNLTLAFHLGLLVNVVLLLGCRGWFRLAGFGIQVVNTLALLLVGLPAADLFLRPAYSRAEYLEPAKRYFSYTAAKHDPATFARWCRAYQAQWERMAGGGVFMPDPARVLTVRLRPGGRGMLFDSEIRINSRGFRGPEFAAEKGRAYRIVVLGESSTFGCTINPGEKPWPELLEELIQKRLHPRRPVEVINAGVPANHLGHALYRLPAEIFPLQPDMIISYHGYNGFGYLRAALPASFGRMPPAYRQRPLKLLGDGEYRLRSLLYKRAVNAERRRTSPEVADPLQTIYADQYRRLIQAVQTNHIRLVLANFSMALDRRSPSDLVAFYRPGFPAAYWHIRANEVHSAIVQQLAQQDSRICFVDTHPGLDGENEKFIDLVHLTQEGCQQLAETIFAGIKPVLEEDLARAP